MAPSDPADATEDLSAPRRVSVGRYEIRRELGSGAMGTVWRAFDPRLERDVAIKEVHLPPDMPPRERTRARARVVREARAAARVSHPSVVTVHDVFEVDGTPFIVMELLDGESLRDRLHRSGPLSEREVERIARPLLAALHAAHRAGVIHRDVKPANIMLTGDDSRPVLTDFGIANLVDNGATDLTGTGTILGTAAYAAPERLDRDETTVFSDLWSLGATLFAALTGTSPFKRDTLTATLTAVLTLPVPTPPAGPPLTALIGGLLERDPRRRLTPERALAVLDGPVPDPPTAAAAPVAPWRARRHLLWAGAAVLAVLVAAAAGGRILAAPSPEGIGKAASDPAEEGSGRGEEHRFDVFDDGVIRLMVPADWEVEDITDEYEGEASTRLAEYSFETGVETGTATASASEFEVLALGARDSLLRLEQILTQDAGFTDVDRHRLDDGPSRDGYESAVYEVTFHHEEREVPERWMLAREISHEESGRSYRMTLNFPEELREEYENDFDEMLGYFGPAD